jgi:hypothetical protein
MASELAQEEVALAFVFRGEVHLCSYWFEQN